MFFGRGAKAQKQVIGQQDTSSAICSERLNQNLSVDRWWLVFKLKLTQ
jgi:hypothetical protein